MCLRGTMHEVEKIVHGCLVCRYVQDDSDEWPCEERRTCYASSHRGGHRFEWEHGTPPWYVILHPVKPAPRVLFDHHRPLGFHLVTIRYTTDKCKLLHQNQRKPPRRNARLARWRPMATSIIPVLQRKYAQSQLQE